MVHGRRHWRALVSFALCLVVPAATCAQAPDPHALGPAAFPHRGSSRYGGRVTWGSGVFVTLRPAAMP